MLQGAVLAWHEALTDGKVWDETLDVPRFRRAFIRYGASTNHHWPIPADIVALLPAREELKALPVVASDPERAQRIMDEIARSLRA